MTNGKHQVTHTFNAIHYYRSLTAFGLGRLSLGPLLDPHNDPQQHQTNRIDDKRKRASNATKDETSKMTEKKI